MLANLTALQSSRLLHSLPMLLAIVSGPAAAIARADFATESPDRVILTLAGDPATSMAVTWRTDATVATPRAQLAMDDHGPQFEPLARTFSATTAPLVTSTGRAACHTVVFNDLTPAARYLYRVGDGTRWSEWSHFQTASRGAEPFRFVYLGDAQNNIRSHWSRVIRAAYAAAPTARFIVHAGDLVNRGTKDSEWGEWFQAAGWINQVIPSLPSPGNHEYAKAADGVSRITDHWRAQFALPENGPKGLEETAYFVDYQGLRFVSLNSNEHQQEQADWLRRVLQQDPCRWTVVAFHHPIYSTGKNRDNVELRRLWQPIFDRYRVDLVLQGHDHAYARTGLRTTSAADGGGTTPDAPGGTVYVNSVAGPKQYAVARRPEHLRTAEGTQLFQVVSVDGDRLRLEARTATGDLYDAFELRKRTDQPNELTECGPGTPERHVPPPASKPAVPKAAMVR